MRLTHSVSFGLMLLIFVPLMVRAEVGSISYLECEVNGYRVGTSMEAMIQALGDSLPPPTGRPSDQPIDIMNYQFDYGGLLVLFGPSPDSSWAFRIFSDKFRLKSGISVGSTEQEVLTYYGPTERAVFDDRLILPYEVRWAEGQRSAIHVDFTIVDGIVSRIDVHPRQDSIDIEIGYPPY